MSSIDQNKHRPKTTRTILAICVVAIVFCSVIGDNLVQGIILGLIFSAPVSIGIFFHNRRIHRMLDRNFHWYRQQHPSCVKNNRVTCASCGATSIRVRALMQKTYMREHFCSVCGEVLYFSPEGR